MDQLGTSILGTKVNAKSGKFLGFWIHLAHGPHVGCEVGKSGNAQ